MRKQNPPVHETGGFCSFGGWMLVLGPVQAVCRSGGMSVVAPTIRPMDKAGWFLITSAIVIPLLTALVARSATHYSARLQAAQKQRDIEIAHLIEFRNELMGCVGAAQRAVYYLKTSRRRPPDVIVQVICSHIGT